jgi:hypothetical protein
MYLHFSVLYILNVSFSNLAEFCVFLFLHPFYN